MTRTLMATRADGPLRTLDLVDEGSASGESSVSFGAGHLLRLARRLVSDGWRVREIDLRDFFLEVPTDDETEPTKTALRQALQSSDDNYLSDLAAGLPYVLSSIRLAHGAIGEGTYWAKFYRNGRIDSSNGSAMAAIDLDYLRALVQQVWAGE